MSDMVTLDRAEYERMLKRLADYDALLEEIEDAGDLALIAQRRDDETIPVEMVDRILDGENRVKVWREHRGLSQGDLARAAGLSAVTIGEIETGSPPSLQAANAIAGALRLGLDDLFLEPASATEARTDP